MTLRTVSYTHLDVYKRQSLHSKARATQDGRGDAGRAAPVGDLGKGRVVELLTERADLFGRGPDDELVERDALLLGQRFGFLFQLLR